MKSKVSKLIIGLFACMAVILGYNVKAHADSANVSVSSANGSVGDTVSVSVKVTPDVDAMAQLAISYDTNYLEYVSGGTNGVAGIVMEILDDVKAGTTGEFVVNFRLRTAGTTTISIADSTQVLPINGSSDAAMNTNNSNGTVTINSATAASNDNHLSGLNVQAISQNGDSTAVVYTPSFSPDVYEYKADLPATTTRLVVSTTLSDANSTTKVSGTRIDPGNNKTTITVTAEDGSQSQYTLYTTRASEVPTETTTAGENSSEGETTDIDRSPKEIKSMNKYLIQDFSLVAVPEGFEESTANYEGQTIAVLKGIAKELTLVCLADDAQGTNVEIYIYNEASGAMDKMVNITSTQKIYTIIPTDDGYVGPEGYTQTTLDVNGVGVKAWIKSEGSEFYVVYAMNWNGEKALYVYDTKEQTMQRFVEGNKSQTFEDEPEEENKEYLAMKKQFDDMYKEYVNDHSKKNKTIIALLIILVVVIIGAIMLFIKQKGQYHYSEEELEEIDEDEPQKELNLDMVAQVNEVKADKLVEEVSEALEESTEEDMSEIMEENEEDITKEMQKDPTVSADEQGEEILINMEEDEPFEIEFVDLEEDENK